LTFLFEGLDMTAQIEKIEKEIEEFELQLQDRIDALPAHSIRPHQLMIIEELEEAVAEKQKMLEKLKPQP
jgi:hypothetical protein